jgi:hypothetical protein
MRRAVMQQALEALEKGETKLRWAAISALKQALAEPEQEQEPFILQTDAIGMRRPELRESHQITLTAGTAIYIAPTPRKPQTTHWEGCEAVHPECRKPDTDCHLQGICQRSGYSIAPTPRKPLTDEEIVQVLGSVRESITGNVFLAFARAIERAHGITGEKT